MSVSGNKKDLEDFFGQVFNENINFSGVVFPSSVAGCICMVNPPSLTTEKVLRDLAKYADVVAGTWLSLKEENLIQVDSTIRPQDMYSFSYLDSQIPEIFGVSQDEVVTQGVSFMTVKEYLLATGFNYFRTGSFWDTETETVLAECWNYGTVNSGMVYGFYQHRGRNPEGHDPEGYNGICLFNGGSAFKIKTAGVRKVTF